MFRITGIEASLDGFYRTGLVEHCGQTEIHAMYLYEALKYLCRQHGHTYVKVGRLEWQALVVWRKYHQPSKAKSQPFSKPQGDVVPIAVDFGSALDLLEDWHVIVRENNNLHVFLHRYWHAEVKIAEAFGDLRKWHEVEPWTFEIDAGKYVCTCLSSR